MKLLLWFDAKWAYAQYFKTAWDDIFVASIIAVSDRSTWYERLWREGKQTESWFNETEKLPTLRVSLTERIEDYAGNKVNTLSFFFDAKPVRTSRCSPSGVSWQQLFEWGNIDLVTNRRRKKSCLKTGTISCLWNVSHSREVNFLLGQVISVTR